MIRCCQGFVRACALAVMLNGCGGGGDGSAAPPPQPPAPPPPPVSGLLSDAQLATGPDADAAAVDPAVEAWFAQQAKVVRSITESSDFSDLDFLGAAVQGKRLVMLGESSHGVRQFSRAKLRMIRYLHERQGFNVLAMEGGLFDCENTQRLLAANVISEAMRACLFGVWHTATLDELLRYIASTYRTDTPLRIIGFDVQASGNTFAQRATRTAALVRVVSPEYADEVAALERDYARLTADALAASNAQDPANSNLSRRLAEFATEYLLLADFLMANIDVIAAAPNVTRRDVLIAAQYTRTSPFYAQQLSERFQFGGGNRPRDAGMAQNLIALATDIYPQERIIGWAHNAHLRHRGTGFVPGANMGALVHDALSPLLYTVGFYMYRGQHAFNDRSVQNVSPPLADSLEAIFHTRRLAFLFLDIENAPVDAAGGDWLTRSTPTWAWGHEPISLVLADEYDGVFVIDTVSPPDYL